jgi:glycosyltransferase involved in cell wall biosynthesis
MSKKVSIITVNYNDKPGLEKTIQNVLAQTSNDYQFIVMDGGSTDGSVDVLSQYKDRIDIAVSEKDSGVFNAMNKAIRAASGEFLIFMNGGDIFYDEKVLEEVIPMLTNEADIYYGDNYKETPGGSKRLKTYPGKLNFSFFYTSSINHQSTFIRRSLFEKYFYYNENYRIAADWEFFVYTICKENVPYRYLKRTIAIYDFTGISSNPKSSELFIKEKSQTFQRYFPAFVDDYKEVSELNSKRFLQFQHIKNHQFAFKILKGFIGLILLFLPKVPKK